MNVQNLVKTKKSTKNVMLSIRITPEAAQWLKEKNYSPTAILNEAMKDLGYGKTE